jgi:ribA/ribD-fused uncharacterized protein
MIDSFKGGYSFLSNFEPCDIEYNGVAFNSVEHAYQAAKATNMEDMLKVAACNTPGQAKRMGKKIKMRPDWDAVKIQIMSDLVRQKFYKPEFKQKLLDTKDHELIEGNTWGDKIWGCIWNGSQWVGQNNLGKILMQIRNELRT